LRLSVFNRRQQSLSKKGLQLRMARYCRKGTGHGHGWRVLYVLDHHRHDCYVRQVNSAHSAQRMFNPKSTNRREHLRSVAARMNSSACVCTIAPESLIHLAPRASTNGTSLSIHKYRRNSNGYPKPQKKSKTSTIQPTSHTYMATTTAPIDTRGSHVAADNEFPAPRTAG
jgi:hypothetical protein